jgi:NADH-quinone oxidoreductase subunit C
MPDHLSILARFPQTTWDAATSILIIPKEIAVEVATFLRGDPAFVLDFCSNVTGVDYLSVEKKEKVKQPDGAETETVSITPGRMDVVYHLYSMRNKTGPFTIKQVAASRENPVVASLTPVWRSCEFQEREIFDLYGIHFENHPDLRRILMWDEFLDFPMRKDYREPDDYEYEPTPHADILEKAKSHYAQ